MSAFDPGAAAAAGTGIFGLPFTVEEAKVVVVPVPFAATTSYGGGAQSGPEAILAASRQVDLFDVETGRPYEAKIAMLDIPDEIALLHREARPLAERVIEAGGVTGGDPELTTALNRVNAACDGVNRWVHERTAAELARGRLIAIVGGDHATPFGAIRACAEAHPGLGVLHVDAHADLRDAFEGFTWSHASIMHNVISRLPGVARLVQIGIRDLSEAEYDTIRGSRGRIVTTFDADIQRARFRGTTWGEQVARIVRDLPARVYISFDIDGLDPALCPHTGTPVPGGLTFAEATALVAEVARSGRMIVGVDVNEVSPGPDGDEWDGNVGARILYKLIGWMLVSNGLCRPPSDAPSGTFPPP
jgi:agmatinase